MTSYFFLCTTAWRQHDFNQLLPSVPSDEVGQAAEQGRGHPDPPLDLHQILPSPALGGHSHRTHLLHLRRRRHAGLYYFFNFLDDFR